MDWSLHDFLALLVEVEVVEIEVEDWKGRPLSSPNEQRYLESVTKMMIPLSSLSTIAMPLLYRLSFACIMFVGKK